MKQLIGLSLSQITRLAVLVLVLALPLAVFADDVSNNLDATVDAVAEQMPLVLGGPNGTTRLYITPRNGDGKNGCNLTGSTTLVVSVTSSNSLVATVSPASITFTSCVVESNGPTLTVTPVSLGTTTISVGLVSNNTGGTFNLTTATFDVTVAPPPNTPPTISVTGVTGGASYEIGSVPAAVCFVVDAEDGNSTFPATLSAISGPFSAYGIGLQTASCSYTDGGGLSAGASEMYGIVDTVAPVITFVSRTSANANNWNNGDVAVNWSCTDGGSGVVIAGVSQTVSAEGANQSASGLCEDHVGNTASDTQTGIYIDKTAPTASASALPVPNGYGWNNSNVTVSFSGSDGLSGVASCSASFVLTSEGTGQSALGYCTDNAGNVSGPALASGINIDKTAPTASASALPAPNSKGWNNSNVTVSFNGSDGLSGIDSCSPSVVLISEGADQSATGTCTDKAGNSVSASASGINIDKTGPVVAVTGVVNGATYTLGSVPAAGCSTSDALSDVAVNASLIQSGGPVGTVVTTCSGAMDNADNAGTTVIATYYVHYNWNGFFRPVDNLPTWNQVKAGSAIPVKFSLNGYQGLGIFMTGYPSSVKITCDSAAPVDAIEETVTAGSSSLSYDATSDQYNYVWKTDKAWAGTCRQFTVKLVDGTTYTANFKFTK